VAFGALDPSTNSAPEDGTIISSNKIFCDDDDDGFQANQPSLCKLSGG